MVVILIFISGLIFGLLLGYLYVLNTYDGVLKVDTTNPDTDSYMLEFTNTMLDDIPNKKYVRFRVYTKS